MSSSGFPKCINQYDQLLTIIDVQSQSYDECLNAFQDLLLRLNSMRLQISEYAKKTKELGEKLEKKSKENQNLENRLQFARRFNDQATTLKKKAEEEKRLLELQVQKIRDLLFGDARNKIHDETRDKLQLLNATFLPRASLDSIDRNSGGDKLSMHNKFDPTGSILSDLSYSRSEDDLDPALESWMKARICKRSIAPEDAISVKRRTIGRRSFMSMDITQGECLLSTAQVTVCYGGMPATPQSVTVPSALKEESYSNFTSPQMITGERTGYHYTTPSSKNVFKFQSITRGHNLVQETIMKPENCDPCGKRIKFIRGVLKCLKCRTICHPKCRDQLSLFCIPPGSTSTPKGTTQLMNIADYAPPIYPMIPALVVHCVNEVEKRGPQEVGIYRAPGKIREAEALKQRFLSRKGVPNMSLVADIHTVCSCLKDFLISLKEPLATYALWSKFVKAAGNEDQTTRQAELYQTFTELPQANRDTLAFLLLHLQNVAQMPNTSMTIKSLSDIFGPTIIGKSCPDLTAYQAFLEAQQSCHVLQSLLEVSSDYWNSYLNTQETHSKAPTPREQCGFFYSPPSSEWYTVRKKRQV